MRADEARHRDVDHGFAVSWLTSLEGGASRGMLSVVDSQIEIAHLGNDPGPIDDRYVLLVFGAVANAILHHSAGVTIHRTAESMAEEDVSAASDYARELGLKKFYVRGG